MKLWGIVGSPREGNTQYLVSEALAAFESAGRAEKVPVEVGLVCLHDKHIEGCRACDNCERTGTCVIDDDARAIYEQMIDADAIIIGSPVYYGDVTAQLKALMDRAWPYRKRLKDKVGGAIAVGGESYWGRTIETIHIWFEMHQMIIPCGGVVGHAWDIREIEKDKQAIEDARTLGKRIFEVLFYRR